MIKPDWVNSLAHCSNEDYLSNPYPRLGEVITVRLSADPKAPIRQVILRTIPDGEQQFTSMVRVANKQGLAIWQAELLISQPLVHYRFGIQSDAYVWWLNAAGVDIIEPFSLFDYKIVANTRPISWLSDAVFYQIFPDRFANGDPSNDPNDELPTYRNMTRSTLPWGEANPTSDYGLTFYGGDLKGIQQHLDHLQELGVNALYLNPIFNSHTNHRYDCTDYERVDPALGGDNALIDLRAALDRNKMRMILDIAPNHCSVGHPWFQQALKNRQSEEAGFFFFDEASDNYASWMGHSMLPKLNYASATLRQRMYAGEHSIIRKWLKPPFNADGWRIDVANMLGKRADQQFDREVIAGIRTAVKETRPDAYLIGENFYEASAQLDGNGWDGVMNYAGFTQPLWYWLAGYQPGAMHWEGKLEAQSAWTTDALVRTWQGYLASIPWQIALQQFNLLDSHDTSRIGTLVKGDVDRHKLAAIVQFTFPGVPCVYYGDEIGMHDEQGFGARNCMNWDRSQWDLNLWNFYRQLIAFRKGSRILQEGSFRVLTWDDDFILFERALGSHRILVSANRSTETRLAGSINVDFQKDIADLSYTSLFDGRVATVKSESLLMPELTQGGAIWVEDSCIGQGII